MTGNVYMNINMDFFVYWLTMDYASLTCQVRLLPVALPKFINSWDYTSTNGEKLASDTCVVFCVKAKIPNDHLDR